MKKYKSWSILIVSLVLICGTLFTASQILAVASPTINTVSLIPSDTSWPAGTVKNIQVSYSGYSASTVAKTSVRLCHPTNTSSCTELANSANTSNLADGNFIVAPTLGLTNSNRLFERLVGGEITEYYLKVGNNLFKFSLKICPINAAGSDVGTCKTLTDFYVAPSPTATVAKVDGAWSAWSACSATTCGTSGTQTRLCNNPFPSGGGADCNGPSTETCQAASCVNTASPSITSINNGATLGVLQAGVTKLIPFSYSGFSSTVNKVQMSLCHDTGANSPCSIEGVFTISPSGSTSGSTSTAKTIGRPDGYLYDRLAKAFSVGGDTITTYYTRERRASPSSDIFSSYFKFCPYNTSNQVVGTCKFVDFSVAPGASTPVVGVWGDWSACSYPTCQAQTRTCSSGACVGESTQACSSLNCQAVGPKIIGVSIPLPANNVWRSGEDKTISWDYFGFGKDATLKTYVTTVSLFICDKAGTKCFPWSGTVNNEKDNQINSVTGSPLVVTSGKMTLLKTPGPGLYDRLLSSDRSGLLSIFPTTKPFEARLKVCPSYSKNAPAGYNLSSGGYNANSGAQFAAGVSLPDSFCSLSPIFTLGPNINNDPSASFSLPSGQGCFVGECVCVSGKRAVCGSPMQSGARCPVTASCPGVLTYSMSDKMMASVFSVANLVDKFFAGFNK